MNETISFANFTWVSVLQWKNEKKNQRFGKICNEKYAIPKDIENNLSKEVFIIYKVNLVV